ncbi:glycine receptor subunit alpha-2-like [Varroa jacobsoni]|uniref:glycine receptor subunit alpha-2-like n=1 Tax=Varroa jacobsoni TaxID=62625 RepID=UPI000BF79DE3|nr:glycine receptor subunit alpha-2-like [Varroa jacobsoni]
MRKIQRFFGIVKYGTVSDLDKLDNTLKSYDRRALPSGYHDGSGGPTNVSCEVYIRSFGSINPATMDYEVDLYLRQRWYDGRLAKVNISAPLDLNDPKLVQKIWKPEVFFANAKHAEFQFVTVPNVLVRLTPHGMILYMLRLKLTFSCMMDLYRYPLDVQTCTIELASFSKTTDELVLHWSERNPIILFENLKLPQFEIQNVSTSLCNETFYLGEYSCLKAEFHLQRSMGYHLVQSYLPTVLIVVISWVSFWLDVEAIPARITLGVTTLLTISSKITTNNGGTQTANVENVEPAGILADSRARFNSHLQASSLQMSHGSAATQLFAFYLNCNQVNIEEDKEKNGALSTFTDKGPSYRVLSITFG